LQRRLDFPVAIDAELFSIVRSIWVGGELGQHARQSGNTLNLLRWDDNCNTCAVVLPLKFVPVLAISKKIGERRNPQPLEGS
jgi:hypothetical protein